MLDRRSARSWSGLVAMVSPDGKLIECDGWACPSLREVCHGLIVMGWPKGRKIQIRRGDDYSVVLGTVSIRDVIEGDAATDPAWWLARQGKASEAA